jgi:pimeloyl-ACP methyl ester carboxylesterase
MTCDRTLLACAFLLAITTGTFAAEAPDIALSRCTLEGGTGIASIEARCGWLSRPENPDAPDGRKIDLRVAVIPALSPNPQPDALTVINGGPGGSSIDMYADMAATFSAIQRERDILIVDQRGTGASNPMDCPRLEDADMNATEAYIRKATRSCLEDLPGDPRFYTTSLAVDDLDAARQALGYPSLNVYGVSYGTRVGQHYARRYPDHIRTLIIDGVAPPEVPLGPIAALNAQRTLDRLFERCAGDEACHKRFPDLSGQLNALSQTLEAASVPVTAAHPVTGIATPIQVTQTHLLLTIRMLSYAPETARLIPLIIDEAASRDNFVPLAANALRIEKELSGAIRFGMHNSVICTEDAPFFGDLDRPALEATYIGPRQAQSLIAICKEWPTGPMDDDLRQPLRVDVPTLILSGEEDPITPPAYGDMADASLPKSLHLIGGGQGHGVIGRGCFPRLAAEFIDSGTLEGLDPGCVERLTHPSFFLNLMGPIAIEAPGAGEGET